jgi:signal peptidase II
MANQTELTEPSAVERRSARPTAGQRPGRFWTFALAAFVLGVDQLVKGILAARLPAEGAQVGPLFRFRPVENQGINFGLFADHPVIILAGTLAVGVGFCAYVLWRPPPNWWSVTGFGLMLGGGFGNVLDRLRLGAVFDYLNITPFVGYLNFADLAIGAGIIVLIVDALFLRGRRGEPAPE